MKDYTIILDDGTMVTQFRLNLATDSMIWDFGALS